MPQVVIPIYQSLSWNPNDNNDIVIWQPNQLLSGFDTISIFYVFDQPQPFGSTLPSTISVELQASDDGITWITIGSITTINLLNGPLVHYGKHAYYRFEVDNITGSTNFSFTLYYQYLKTGA